MFENYVETMTVDGQVVDLSLWDTAGTSAALPLFSPLYMGLIVYHSQDKKSMRSPGCIPETMLTLELQI